MTTKKTKMLFLCTVVSVFSAIGYASEYSFDTDIDKKHLELNKKKYRHEFVSTLSGDPCSDNPCRNGGQCRIEGSTYKCFCPSPFTGRTCNSRLCFSNLCENGGTCYYHYDAAAGSKFSCDCVDPYYGRFCEKMKSSYSTESTLETKTAALNQMATESFLTTEVTSSQSTTVVSKISSAEGGTAIDPNSAAETDPCLDNPCENGGLCREEEFTYKCFCPSPFYGRTCNLDPCSNSPCKNGGICAVNGDSHTCYCQHPFRGKNCEIDGCINNLCQNGGLCKSNGLGFEYKCYCSSPFTGTYCEKGPCSNNPCKNDGICKVEEDAHKCFCTSPFSGKSCEIEEKTTTTSPETTETDQEETTMESTPTPVKCKCKNGKCITTGKETRCVCNPGFAKGDEGVCTACQCGEQYNCTFEAGWFSSTKTCICPEGYEDINGKCTDTCSCENGKCTTTSKGKECVCNPGFGMHPDGYCQVCDCGENHCCTFEKRWLITRKTCICPEGYHEIEGRCVDPCASQPCHNGGKCKLVGDSYECDCPKEFTGKYCQQEKCKCQNGKCIEVGKELKCVCNLDYGMYTEGVCAACNCGEGFTCTFDRGTYSDKIYCVCPEGYSMVDKKCLKIFEEELEFDKKFLEDPAGV